jgi:hypothetical protein
LLEIEFLNHFEESMKNSFSNGFSKFEIQISATNASTRKKLIISVIKKVFLKSDWKIHKKLLLSGFKKDLRRHESSK